MPHTGHMTFTSQAPAYFRYAFDLARKASARVHAATSPFEASDGMRCYLNSDATAGYVIRADGELTNVFSTRRKQGDDIMRHALADGARRLDCFDGYLVGFYSRHGFEIVRREPNWTPGGPDVVFMALPAGFEIGQSR